ncbi:MAG: hypothetical protein QOE90_1522 [Thermoplasmata archaeon]|jgi:hypothetical protein|nr:hypothetical protein [Thermoplasmata archaeon]
MTLPAWVASLGPKHRLVLQRVAENEEPHGEPRVPWNLACRHAEEERAAEELLRGDHLAEPTPGLLLLTETGRAAADWLQKDAERRQVQTPSCPACGLPARARDISPGGTRAICRNKHCRTETYLTTEETIATGKVSA